MEISNNQYTKFNHLYKPSFKYIKNLVIEAYNYNIHFKDYAKTDMIDSMTRIIKQLKKIYNESNHQEIVNLISSMRLWNRYDFPYIIDPDFRFTSALQHRKTQLLNHLHKYNQLFIENIEIVT